MEGLIRQNCSKILTNHMYTYSTVWVYIMIDVTWVVLVVCLVWTSRWELSSASLQKDCWWWWLTFWLPERSSSVRFNLTTEALLINYHWHSHEQLTNLFGLNGRGVFPSKTKISLQTTNKYMFHVSNTYLWPEVEGRKSILITPGFMYLQ